MIPLNLLWERDDDEGQSELATSLLNGHVTLRTWPNDQDEPFSVELTEEDVRAIVSGLNTWLQARSVAP